MKSEFPGFPPDTLRFLRRLKRNNDREWFQAHKDEYERFVREPMIELVTGLGPAVQSFAPEMVADPKRCIYRIYRDTRFSHDKTPYKTQVAALFWPRGQAKHASASLYFHVAPAEVLIAGGVYMPGSAELRRIRRHVAAHHAELRRILKSRSLIRLFGGLEGEQLTRAPQGCAPDHPAIDLLRRKQFLLYTTEPVKLAESPDLIKHLVVSFSAMMPFIRFLNAPL